MQPNIIPAKLAEILLMHIPLMMSTDSPQCFLAGILTGSRGATSVAGAAKTSIFSGTPKCTNTATMPR